MPCQLRSRPSFEQAIRIFTTKQEVLDFNISVLDHKIAMLLEYQQVTIAMLLSELIRTKPEDYATH